MFIRVSNRSMLVGSVTHRNIENVRKQFIFRIAVT